MHPRPAWVASYPSPSSFQVVKASDINAFALPGGPMFVNRGMLAAAKTEGEVAGVMAHELSHVILRHGTAQASQATPYQVGELAGQVLGAIVGGQIGGLIAQGSRFGISLAFMTCQAACGRRPHTSCSVSTISRAPRSPTGGLRPTTSSSDSRPVT